MKLKDLQNTLNSLDAISPELIKDTEITKELDKLRNKLIRKGKREFEDPSMLKALVELIEIMGFPQNKAFIFVDSHYFSESRAKKLWFKTKKENLAKIEDLRQHVAYRLVRPYLEWLVIDLSKDYPSTYSALPAYALSCLKTNEPELFNWALKKAYLEFYDIKHEEFKPEYNKPDLEIDLVSLQKQIASSD